MSAQTATTVLRPWQQEALTAWESARRRGIVEAVTGTGKTRVGIAAVEQCVVEAGRAVVLVPTVELQEQWARQLRDLLPEVRTALLGGGHKPFGAWDVVVAVINTASATDSDGVLSGCTLLVADECHRYGAAGFSTALRRTHPHRLGLTATLERQDDGVKQYLLPYFESLLLTYDYRRAVPEGTVAPFRVALVGVHLTQWERCAYDDLSTRIERAVVSLAPFVDPTRPFFPQVARLARRDDQAGLTASSLLKLVSERRQLLGDS